MEYQFINASFLGKDSLMGSRAGMLFKLLHQKNILHSKKYICSSTRRKKHWITETLLDKEIDQLNISQKQKDRIKKNIKLKIAMLGRKQKNRKS